MEADQRSIIEMLVDPSTTPEQTLQLLSYSCFSPEAYRNGDNKRAIFHEYIRYIMTRLPDACVDGIWEDILRKVVLYLDTQTLKLRYREMPEVFDWLDIAFSSHSKCPNPYIRLLLFSLIRRLPEYGFFRMNNDRLCTMFIHTICEIQPSHLFPNSDVDEVLFGIKDLDHFFLVFHHKLQAIISNDISMQLSKENEVFVESNATRFISHCIQLIGIFAIMAGFNPNPKKQRKEIEKCFILLTEEIGSLICGYHQTGMDPWKQFINIVSRKPFRLYVIETVRDFIAAIIDIKGEDIHRQLIFLRNMAIDLDISTKAKDLPKLLLSRQVNGPSRICQLQLRNLFPDIFSQ